MERLTNEMLNEKISRGTYGYIRYKKNNYGIKALVIAVFMLVLAAVGYLIYGTFRNLIMVPTMVSVIPLANMAACYFAMVRFKTAPLSQYAMLKNFDDAGMLLSDLIIVDSAGKRHLVDFAVVYKGGIVGYSSDSEENKNAPQDHINSLLKKRGVPLTFRIYKDFDEFLKRIDGIPAAEDGGRGTELATETIINSCM